MKKLLLVLLPLFLIGCATTQPKPIYEKVDTTVILIPKEQESKTITLTYTKVDADGKINKVTKDLVIPNIYYPDDIAVMMSKSKFNQDIGATVNDTGKTK